ncbi:unnamed protein product, partial [Prorocentrum cordatum]
MMWKHFFVAYKRRRILTAAWPALVYSGIAAFMIQLFSDRADGDRQDMPFTGALVLALVVPMHLVIAISGAFNCAVIEIVSEKESKMKVVQELYGLSQLLYWASWALYFFCVSLVCIAVICVNLSVLGHLISSQFFVVLMLLAAYMQSFSLAAIASVFFEKKQTAGTAAGLVNLLLMFLGLGAQGLLRGRSRLVWYAAGLLPTVNVFSGLAALMWLEVAYHCDDAGCYRGLGPRTLWQDRLCLRPRPPELCEEHAALEISAPVHVHDGLGRRPLRVPRLVAGQRLAGRVRRRQAPALLG